MHMGPPVETKKTNRAPALGPVPDRLRSRLKPRPFPARAGNGRVEGYIDMWEMGSLQSPMPVDPPTARTCMV
jgi:hypothetical protein